MKKILGIIVLTFALTGNAKADYASCFAGECEFLIGLWYEYAETDCIESFINKEVEQDPIGFTIVETGKYCMVFNER